MTDLQKQWVMVVALCTVWFCVGLATGRLIWGGP